MDNNEKFRWIANEINISDFYDRLPRHIKATIALAEQYDRDENDAAYLNMCDDIEVKAKLLIPSVISDYEWLKICNKYSMP